MITASTESTRAHLLPQNRRLRHLKGIFLRNLTFTRPRGRTTDDSAIHQGSKTLDDLDFGLAPQLHHAASSESLRKLRRRSTNTSLTSGHTLQARQQRIEQSIDNLVADVFLSIHTDVDEEPVYLSETIPRAMNFNFQFFDLSSPDPSISRCDHVVVKVWAKRRGWCLLLELSLRLRDLNFIGPVTNQHFPTNSLIFHLIDGSYSLDLPPAKVTPPREMRPVFTSSYNALMRLSTLENSIQDALATRAVLEEKINNLIKHTAIDELPCQEELNEEVERVVSQQHGILQAAQDKRNQLKASIDARRRAIQDGLDAQAQAERDVETAASKLPSSYALVNQNKSLIHGQRRRLCADLSTIFPITPIPNGPPLAFQVLKIPLPNTEYDPSSPPAQEHTLSAALGYVAYLVYALHFYLGHHIPYAVKPFGSRSSIRDDISVLPDSQREYPLYLRGGVGAHARLDYGWFLLNKDIEALCGALGLRVVDIRHTLPNIKYLLYVGSAGKDELPERKRGGVRGLLMGRVKQRLDGSDHGSNSTTGGRGSRRGSADSEFLARQREEIQRAIRESSFAAATNGGGAGRFTSAGCTNHSGSATGRESSKHANTAGRTQISLGDGSDGADQANVGNANTLVSPTEGSMVDFFDETHKVTLRTRGMREQPHA